MLHSVIASPMVQYRRPFLLKVPDEAWFDVDMMQKDINLAVEMSQRLGVPLQTTKVTNTFLTARGMNLQAAGLRAVFRRARPHVGCDQVTWQ